MNLDALRTLLNAPPFDSMTDQECVAALNAPTVVVQGDVSKARFVLWLAANNGFSVIEQAQQYSSADPALQAAVRTAGRAAEVILQASDVSAINTGDPQVVALLTLFCHAGLLSEAAVESFMAHGRSIKTPAQTIDWSEVAVGDVQQARAL